MIQAGQQAAQEEIDRVLAKLQQKGVGTSTKPVLQVNIDAMMRAKNNGYPKHLYHATLEARIVVNDDQEAMMVAQGYGPGYKLQHYPKFMFRRNHDDKFNPDLTAVTRAERDAMNPFVESREVRNNSEENGLLRAKVQNGCSKWVSSFAELPDEDAPEVDATAENASKMARLEGELAEMRRQESIRLAALESDKGKKVEKSA